MFKTTIIAAGLLVAFTGFAQAQVAAPGAKAPKLTNSSECTFNAAMQPLVRPTEIGSVNAGQKIWLTPICEDDLDRNSYGTLFRDGNVDTLRNVIARNGALMQALTSRGYDHFDVVAIRFSQDRSVNLFVHQRDMR